jgi:TPR repeat protein
MPPHAQARLRFLGAAVVLAAVAAPAVAQSQVPDWKREERERRIADYAACQQKDAAACRRLANYYVEYAPRVGTPIDEARALHFYLKACDAGGNEACFFAGQLEDVGSASPDPAAAARTYQRGCDGGDPMACGRLATLVAEGIGLPRDEVRATALYERGCAGDQDACLAFGIRLQEGRGVAADPARAVEYLQRACVHPVERGCYHLGLAYQQGLGIARDETKARQLLATGCSRAKVGCREACAAGDASSCAWGARLYDTGDEGVPHDSAIASEMYERGIRLLLPLCDAGEADACDSLHRLRRAAQPLQLTDRGLAQRYFSWACTAGGRDGRACFEEARLVEAAGSRDEALAAYDGACSHGSIEGCLRAAVLMPGEAAHYRARAAELRRYEER